MYKDLKRRCTSIGLLSKPDLSASFSNLVNIKDLMTGPKGNTVSRRVSH